MRHLTRAAKWVHLARFTVNRSGGVAFPLTWLPFRLKMMRYEKLTVLAGRTFIKATDPILESAAYHTAADGLARIRRGEHRLLNLCISPTLRCPMNCFYCYARNHPPTEELSTSRLVSLIHEAQELGAFSIHYSGGEPLLRRDLSELIAATDERSNSLVMTSGFKFPETSRKLKEAGLETVVVSLDTFDEAAYNARRGHANAYGIAMEAVRASLRDGFYTALGMLPDASMVESEAFDGYVRAAGRLGVHEIRVSAPRPCVALGRDRARLLTPAQVDNFRRFQKRFNAMTDLPTIVSMDWVEYPENRGCSAGTVYCHVAPSGEVTPCTMSPISFGNVRERPLAEVYANMRRYIPYPPPRCPLPGIYRLIRDIPNDQIPVRNPKTVEQIYRKLNAAPQPLPAFWKSLGMRKNA